MTALEACRCLREMDREMGAVAVETNGCRQDKQRY